MPADAPAHDAVLAILYGLLGNVEANAGRVPDWLDGSKAPPARPLDEPEAPGCLSVRGSAP